MDDKRITVADVARAAGVSKGTVDRVLHDRGEVSPKSAEKVKAAIKALGFERNLYASSLASRKIRTIALLIPFYDKGSYWEKIHEGFDEEIRNQACFNIRESVFQYDHTDLESFRCACSRLLESEVSAVVMPPVFVNDMDDLTRALKDRAIPYVYVDTKPQDDGYLAYYGMNMYKSGYLCASLLTGRLPQEDVTSVAIVRIFRDKAGLADPTVTRRLGFMDYMSEMFPECDLLNVFIDPSDPEGIDSALESFFARHPQTNMIVMFNSRIHLISSYLESHPAESRIVVGFDSLGGNLSMLRLGQTDLLISQRIEVQSIFAVKALSDYLLLGKAPQKKDNYMHMEILTALNCDD